MASQKKLVCTITDELADTTSSLAGPLLKIKILASRIGSQELVEWINKEIQGYDVGQVPEYRNAKTHVTCTIQQGYYTGDNQVFPIMLLDQPWLDYFLKTPFDEGIEALEHLINNSGKSSVVSKVFGVDFDAIINAHISREKSQNFRVSNIRKDVSISQIKNIVSNIRSQLLDLMLDLEKNFKDAQDEAQEEIVANHVINQFMTQIHITSSGTGNTINTGDKNTISVTNNISKGDTSALKKAFRAQHIAEADIEDIASIVEVEPYDESSKAFGTKTREWVSKMINKSLDGSWQVGVGAAGTLLAEGLKAYYGAH
jgi:hypothetical protein